MSSGSTLHPQPQLSQPAHHPQPEGETACLSVFKFCLSLSLSVCLSAQPVCLCLSAGVSWSHFLSSGLRPAEFCLSAAGPEHHCGAAGTKPGRLHCENSCCLLYCFRASGGLGGPQGASGPRKNIKSSLRKKLLIFYSGLNTER